MEENKTPDFAKMAELFFQGLSPNIGEMAKGFFKASFYKKGFEDFSFIAWPKAKDPYNKNLMVKSRALRESIIISKATPDTVEVDAGRGIPYAAIQNSGGTTFITITPRMRKFFWAMFMKTADEDWKWMALTKKKFLTIKIPQRQFIGDSHILNKQIDKYIIEKILKAQAAVTPK